MADQPQPLTASEARAAAEVLEALRPLSAEQAERVLAHVQDQLDAQLDARPMFARGIAGPLGKLICAVKTKVDEVTYELFLQLCAARRMDVASVLRDCIYALVHGKTYQQMVVERINHDAKRSEALVKLIGSFEGPEFERESRHG
ncbi:hypothetical protein [Pulveribacter sp.]|uniref:hypothetical protein n=1 Tax=Pulveribacter sp. TaxID=2678893 RepID=UPI0028B14448|nr:hypothetical protein [Pulveribacter sp.]